MSSGRPIPPGERLVRIIDEHWMVYVLPVFIAILIFAAAIAFLLLAGSTLTESEWIWRLSFVLGSFFLLLSIHGFFLILLNESLSQIVITTKRVIRFHDNLPFGEKMLEVSYERMKTVEARKHGVLQTLLNYGSLNFEEQKAVITYVPHPNSAVRDIEQAMGMR